MSPDFDTLAVGPDGSTHRVHHCLKCWPDEYRQIETGAKRHDFRANDRKFARGDLVLQEEWDPMTEVYTGRRVLGRITAINYGPEYGIPVEFCAFTFEALELARILRPVAGQG